MKKRQFQMGVAAAVLLAAVCGRAQEPSLGSFKDAEPTALQRKMPGFWHRPEKETAASQLAYADALAQEGRLRRAAREYSALVHAWHDTPEAVKAQRSYAEILERRGKYNQAFDEFQYLINFYAGTFPYDAVLERQFRLANEVMNQRHAKILLLGGFKSPERALPLLRQLAANGPSWEKAPEVHFLIGWILEEDRDYESAIVAYDTVRQRWPRDELAASAAYGGTRCLVRIADANKRDEVSCRRALTALAGFLSEYPDDPNAVTVTAERDRLSDRLARLYYDRAVFYDEMAKRPAAALIAYADFLRQFPYAKQAEAVSLRMRELEAMPPTGEEANDTEDADNPLPVSREDEL